MDAFNLIHLQADAAVLGRRTAAIESAFARSYQIANGVVELAAKHGVPTSPPPKKARHKRAAVGS